MKNHCQDSILKKIRIQSCEYSLILNKCKNLARKKGTKNTAVFSNEYMHLKKKPPLSFLLV